jgi:hypothetical protein
LNAINCDVVINGSITSGSVAAKSLVYAGRNPQNALVPPLVARKGFPVSDPCVTIAGCAYLRNSVFPTAAMDPRLQPNLSPGTYVNCCAGDVSLAPGVYYFYGGITGGSLIGTGVTIVNVDGPVVFNGRGGMNVTAPETGPTAGVAFYQPPSNHNDFRGNGSSSQFVGLFYAPSADYTTHGKGDSFSVLVVGGLGVTGAKTVTVDPGLGNPAIQRAAQPTHAVLSE